MVEAEFFNIDHRYVVVLDESNHLSEIINQCSYFTLHCTTDWAVQTNETQSNSERITENEVDDNGNSFQLSQEEMWISG